MIRFTLLMLDCITEGVSVISLTLGIDMEFPFNFRIEGYIPRDIVDVFKNTLIIEMGRPIINGKEVDERTWNTVKKIISSRCMVCFPVHYPALYIRLHNNNKGTSRRAAYMFNDVMSKILKRGCPCDCHLKGGHDR